MRLSTEPVDLFPERSPVRDHANSHWFLGQFPDVVFDRLLQGFAHRGSTSACALGNLILDGKNDVHGQSMWECLSRVNVENRFSATRTPERSQLQFVYAVSPTCVVVQFVCSRLVFGFTGIGN